MRVATTDASLVQDTLQGDPKAFERLIERHEGTLLATAAHLMGDAEAGRDLAQDALISAYQNLRTLRDPSRFGAWLFGILRNKCRRQMRKGRRAPVSAEVVEAPHTDPDVVERRALLDALDRLPLDQKDILSARYLHELSYDEIAALMDSTPGSIRVRCLKARRALRRILTEEEAMDDDE
ncbi:MAG: sigma-70 family RNA polymerase sigma factor [Armatimonadia bacterium]|nr:sigma-70 family RNA polymerase sigma factor [Armatimonadia bacterium]